MPGAPPPPAEGLAVPSWAALRTSRLMIRLSGPVGVILLTSRPCSLASLRASGLILMLPPAGGGGEES